MQVKHSVVHRKVTQVALPNVACCRAAVVNNNDPCFFLRHYLQVDCLENSWQGLLRDVGVIGRKWNALFEFYTWPNFHSTVSLVNMLDFTALRFRSKKVTWLPWSFCIVLGKGVRRSVILYGFVMNLHLVQPHSHLNVAVMKR